VSRDPRQVRTRVETVGWFAVMRQAGPAPGAWRLGWSAADPAHAIVAARVCLNGGGLLAAANEHDIA
jgi:hypothetical protein